MWQVAIQKEMLAPLPKFRRLSAPGASALSIWELTASEADFASLLGSTFCPDLDLPRLVSLSTSKGEVFDQGVFWLRERCCHGDQPRASSCHGIRAELHLHGGHGPASALRQRLLELGWSAATSALGSDSDWGRFLHARGHLNACAANARLGKAPNELAHRQGQFPGSESQLFQWARDLHPFLGWAKVLETPPKIVLAGLPNSGKSTLFNSWLQAERVTVSPHPGTTRDAVEAGVLLATKRGTLEALLVDTAGIWQTGEVLDLAAIEESERALRQAWKVIWVMEPGAMEDRQAALLKKWARPTDLLFCNKADVSPGGQVPPSWLPPMPCIVGSAAEDGLQLIRRLEMALIEDLGPIPAPGQWLPLLEEERMEVQRILQTRTP